jgi:hypothetical protein
MKSEDLIRLAALDPDRASELVQAFDETWTLIAPDHADRPRSIESARLELATIMLALAQDGARNMDFIQRRAIQLMQEH